MHKIEPIQQTKEQMKHNGRKGAGAPLALTASWNHTTILSTNHVHSKTGTGNAKCNMTVNLPCKQIRFGAACVMNYVF